MEIEVENQLQSSTDTIHIEAEVIPELSGCSPPRKKQKIDMECILMEDEPTDMDINFAQQLLKLQFKHIDGLRSTLLQEKELALTATLLQNQSQITYCVGRKHWIVATTIGCGHDKVKVYDSFFQVLDKESLQCIECLFGCNKVVPRVKMIQCPKQVRSKDCGVFAIANATSLAFGLNPTRQNYKQNLI